MPGFRFSAYLFHERGRVEVNCKVRYPCTPTGYIVEAFEGDLGKSLARDIADDQTFETWHCFGQQIDIIISQIGGRAAARAFGGQRQGPEVLE